MQWNYRILSEFLIEPNSIEIIQVRTSNCTQTFSNFLIIIVFFVKSSFRFDRTEPINWTKFIIFITWMHHIPFILKFDSIDWSRNFYKKIYDRYYYSKKFKFCIFSRFYQIFFFIPDGYYYICKIGKIIWTKYLEIYLFLVFLLFLFLFLS